MTGDVMFEAVLLDLQRVVEGSIELLHSHFDWTLQVHFTYHDMTTKVIINNVNVRALLAPYRHGICNISVFISLF